MSDIDALIRQALNEDIGRGDPTTRLSPKGRLKKPSSAYGATNGWSGDITTEIFIPKNKKFTAIMSAKENGILCGVNVAQRVFEITDPSAAVKVFLKDGSRLSKGDEIMRVKGGRKILTAERTALNFIQHLSGIATLTGKFADKIKNKKIFIYDTRKTIPGLRKLEKYAVSAGGGKNHRMGLYDAFLIKDNHIAAIGGDFGKLKEKISEARKKHKKAKIEIEAKTINQVKNFLKLDIDILMLDNMDFATMKKALALANRRGKKKPEIEISGNVNLKRIALLSKLPADRISVGALTHSAKSLDISLSVREDKNGKRP